MSITDTDKLRVRVATLDKLLDDFDGQLDRLLAKSLPETLLELDTLQQAKLQVTIPYLVCDLVIVYLKTKGIDPRTHPVFRELERVKGYIEKVSKAEKQGFEQQRMAVDKAAANRFIKSAIAQAVRVKDQPPQPTGQEPTPGPSKIHAQPVPAGAVNKMLARAEWEKQVQEAEEEGEANLEVFDEAEDYANADAEVEMTDGKTLVSTPLPVGKGEIDVSSERHSDTRLTTTPEYAAAVTKKKKKKTKKVKLPFTNDGDASSNNSQVLSPQPEVHTTVNTIPENPSSTKARRNRKRPFPPSETPAGDPEDSAAASAPPKKKRKGNKSSTTVGAETDGITSRSQSQSQSRDVSVVLTPQVATLPLPGVETDPGVAGVVEKPKKWRRHNRKKESATVQPAAVEADAKP